MNTQALRRRLAALERSSPTALQVVSIVVENGTAEDVIDAALAEEWTKYNTNKPAERISIVRSLVIGNGRVQ